MTIGLLIERSEFALRFNSSQELFLCGPKFISSAFAVNSLLFSLQTVDISIMLHYTPNLTFTGTAQQVFEWGGLKKNA